MRDVFLRHEPNNHVILVAYKDRESMTRHFRAQFDDRNKSMADVERWVRDRSDLRLVCAISGKAI